MKCGVGRADQPLCAVIWVVFVQRCLGKDLDDAANELRKLLPVAPGKGKGKIPRTGAFTLGLD